MSAAADWRVRMARPIPRWVGWLGVVALIALVIGIQRFWTLYALPDQLGTVLYNAYLGDKQGLQEALDELNSLSTYYVETVEGGSPKTVPTGFRFSAEGGALVVTNRSLNSWVADRIISRVNSGAQLRADIGPKATEALRRKSWLDTSRELRRLGLTSLVLLIFA